MILAGARRSLSGLINRSIVTIPNVLRKSTPPGTGMAIPDACTKPSLDQSLAVGQRLVTETGVRARTRHRPSKTRSVLMIHAPHVTGRSLHLLQIHVWRWCLNLSMLGVRPSARFLHVGSYLGISEGRKPLDYRRFVKLAMRACKRGKLGHTRSRNAKSRVSIRRWTSFRMSSRPAGPTNVACSINSLTSCGLAPGSNWCTASRWHPSGMSGIRVNCCHWVQPASRRQS